MGADPTRPDGCTPAGGPLRPVAFYLPQFHPVAQNDEWFGAGFTEWTRVVTARPLWRGHAQPHLPGELGYYDLRVPEVRAAQAALAAAYGLHAFCYWHYWFGGGATILERPLREVVAMGEPDFPFCIGWANHDWSGAAAGMPGRLLVRQEYPGPDDHRAHFAWVRPILEDPRYLRVAGAAVVYVLRPVEAAAAGFVDVWRDEAARCGIGPLYLVGQARPECPDPRALGFDLGCVFPLSYGLPARPVPRTRRGPRVDDYAAYMAEARRVAATDYPGQALGVVTNWDNTPRSGTDGLVLEHATPAALQRVLHDAFTAVDHTTNPHGLVFVKSWNEWAEGNHLEPDRIDGRARLEALAAEVRGHAAVPAAGG